MGEPPTYAGASHVTVACPSPPVACTFCGAAGGRTSRATVTCAPDAVTAPTEMVTPSGEVQDWPLGRVADQTSTPSEGRTSSRAEPVSSCHESCATSCSSGSSRRCTSTPSVPLLGRNASAPVGWRYSSQYSRVADTETTAPRTPADCCDIGTSVVEPPAERSADRPSSQPSCDFCEALKLPAYPELPIAS